MIRFYASYDQRLLRNRKSRKFASIKTYCWTKYIFLRVGFLHFLSNYTDASFSIVLVSRPLQQNPKSREMGLEIRHVHSCNMSDSSSSISHIWRVVRTHLLKVVRLAIKAGLQPLSPVQEGGRFLQNHFCHRCAQTVDQRMNDLQNTFFSQYWKKDI